MRAVAAGRKIANKREHSSNADRGGSNNSSSHAGARQKIANQRSSQQLKSKQSGYTSTSFYTAVPTASQEPNVVPPSSTEASILKSTSVSSSRSRGSMVSGVPIEGRKSSLPTQTRSETPMSSRSLDFNDSRMQSPITANSAGPKKNIKDLMPRNVSNLSHGASSVATTNAGAPSKIESRLGAKLRAREKRYLAKPIALMVVGATFLILGIVFAALYFYGWEYLLMAGPIALSIGLLLFVCGIVWTSIIKAKMKKQRQIMSRTFSV